MKSERLQECINWLIPLLTIMNNNKDVLFVAVSDLKDSRGFKVFCILYGVSIDDLLRNNLVMEWMNDIEMNGWHDYDYLIFKDGIQLDDGEMYEPIEKAYSYDDDGYFRMKKRRKNKLDDLIICP